MTAAATPSGILAAVCPHCRTTNRVARDRLDQGPVCGACKRPLFPKKPFELTAATFDKHAGGEVPLIVDCWAEWCGPCRMIAPILDEIAGEYAGRVKICKLNVDENQGTPPKYGIRGIPTLMLFHNGNVEATKVGAISKSQLTAFLDSNLR